MLFTLNHWRYLNKNEKKEEQSNHFHNLNEKEEKIKLLISLLDSSKNKKIREIINQFRLNRRIVDIQRNFLKRLLMSKSGLVLTAFTIWKKLP